MKKFSKNSGKKYDFFEKNRENFSAKKLFFEKFIEVISYEWDVFSKEESEILKEITNQFIENTYLKDPLRLQRNLTLIQVFKGKSLIFTVLFRIY